MADHTFQLEIVTPDRQLFVGDVVSVQVPGAAGSFGVLANHAPLIASLDCGELKVRDTNGNDRYMMVTGGFFEVSRNHAIALLDGGEWQEEIDVSRAERAYQRAMERLTSAFSTGTDMERARRAADRAKLRMRVAKPPGRRN